MTAQTHEEIVPMPAEKAQRFYDRLRQRIRASLSRKGGFAGRFSEYLLLVPDVFMLLWRLTTDSRVTGKNKVLLGTGLAYFVLPFDIMPEALLGPVGYLDDLVFAVYILNKLISDTDPAILRQHWSGQQDVLDSIAKVLNAADRLVGDGVVDKLKKKTS
jgi:uncharacterized membrane protein YkvA (DUF1232 family)